MNSSSANGGEPCSVRWVVQTRGGTGRCELAYIGEISGVTTPLLSTEVSSLRPLNAMASIRWGRLFSVP